MSISNKTPTNIEPLLVNVKELAKLLSCSVRTSWRLNSSGKLPEPVRIGRSIRWLLPAIKEWISMGCPDRKTFEAKLQTKNGE